MKLKEIPQALRDARARLYEKWRATKTWAEANALIPPVPRDKIIPRFTGSLCSAAHIHARDIAVKDAELARLSIQLSDRHVQLNALNAEATAAKARVIALAQRRDELIRDQATVPARALALCQSLGFDVIGRNEFYSTEAPKN